MLVPRRRTNQTSSSTTDRGQKPSRPCPPSPSRPPLHSPLASHRESPTRAKTHDASISADSGLNGPARCAKSSLPRPGHPENSFVTDGYLTIQQSSRPPLSSPSVPPPPSPPPRNAMPALSPPTVLATAWLSLARRSLSLARKAPRALSNTLCTFPILEIQQSRSCAHD